MADGIIPTPTPETAPYWAAAAAERLSIQRCRACGRHYFYPRSFCPRCQSADVEWTDASGRGRLISYVINYRPFPCTSTGAPQVIALVELEEGVRMLTNIIGSPAEPEALPLDAPVTVAFEPRGDLKVPVFRLDPALSLDAVR